MSEQAPVASSRGRLLGHGVLAGVGLIALAMSLHLGVWRQNSPGEGLFPFLTALAMVAFSGAGLVRDWLDLGTAQDDPGGDGSGRLRVAAYLGALAFYAVTLEFFGFIVATALTVTFILRFAERYSWRATLALTAATLIGCQLLFVLWLGALLPTGTLWEDLLGW